MSRPVKRRLCLGVVIGLAVAMGCGAGISDPTARLPDRLEGRFALVDVAVVTLATDQALPHQTVIVDNGIIAAIGPSDAVPTGDAPALPLPRGAVVMPGLMDLHVHLLDRSELLLYLAAGVTTVRNLHGLPRHLAWRDSLDRGQLVGPRLVTSGPILESPPLHRSTNTAVTSPAAAEAEAASQAAAGFDYLKIYDNLPLPIYQALGRAGRTRGLPVIGHLPDQVGLDGLFAQGVQAEVQHLEEFLPFAADGRHQRLVDSIARGLARSGVAVVPTAGVFVSALAQAESLATLRSRPEMAYVNPATIAAWQWLETGTSRSGNPAALDRYRRTVGFFREALLPELARAGVRIVAGSDAPVPMIIPGFSLLDELDFYREAGLRPVEVLRTATVNAAGALPARLASTGLGTMAAGAPADILVLDGNPLQEAAALRRRLGVIARGTWWSSTRLVRSLDSLAAAYRQGQD